MIFSKTLLAKGLGGLAMIGTGSAGILSTKWYLDNKLTRFDQGLIDHLDNEIGGDIKFSVKNGTSDITDNFPSFTGSETEKTATIKVSVKTNGSSGGDEGEITEKDGASGSSKGTKSYLQKLNGGDSAVDWTWICELKFVREGDSGTELKNKDDLVGASNGFFNKLKGDNKKDLKEKFIRNCAGERGVMENRKISNLESLTASSSSGLIEEDNKLKHSKTFTLKSDGETEAKLVFKNQSEFDTWFKITT